MTDASEIRVYFSCPSCKAVYSVTQKRKPGIIGRFTCKLKTVHRWWAPNTVSRTGVDRSTNGRSLKPSAGCVAPRVVGFNGGLRPPRTGPVVRTDAKDLE